MIHTKYGSPGVSSSGGTAGSHTHTNTCTDRHFCKPFTVTLSKGEWSIILNYIVYTDLSVGVIAGIAFGTVFIIVVIIVIVSVLCSKRKTSK